MADGEHERIPAHRGVAVPEFARVFHFDRDAGDLLNQVLADQGCVQRRPTAGQNDPSNIAKLGRGHVQSTELGGAFFGIETTAHGVTD